MSVETTVEGVDPLERFVLLAVADLTRREEAPVRSYEVLQWCRNRVGDLDHEFVAGVERASVIRALDALASAGLVTVEEVTSPVGKGRPAHALDAPLEEVLAALVEDDSVGTLAASIRKE